ncbi:hypothetical protein [Pendulispora albinea]|uniref:Uncharacterized protein n=1 Tax=Pendulispora albinea TaxID=2741071 RepID=A0ABZ2LSV1_9BACT
MEPRQTSPARIALLGAALSALAYAPAACSRTATSGSSTPPSSSDSIAIPPPASPSPSPPGANPSTPSGGSAQSTSTTASTPTGGTGKPDTRKDCGTMPEDWCASPPNDPCGKYREVKSCRADPKCKGMPFRGESFAPCDNVNGFSTNCPNVGCISR